MRTEVFKGMVREELSKLLSDHGMTENYTLDLLERTIGMARDKKDVTNLMRAIENLQDMHGMKDKHLVKTTDTLEATSTTKLIDELREEENKLLATRTTIKEDE
jgi:AraC-like DNA-binding protein